MMGSLGYWSKQLAGVRVPQFSIVGESSLKVRPRNERSCHCFCHILALVRSIVSICSTNHPWSADAYDLIRGRTAKTVPWFIIFVATILLFLNSTLGFACMTFEIIDIAYFRLHLVADPGYDSPYFKIGDAADFIFSFGVSTICVVAHVRGLIRMLVVHVWRCNCSLEDVGPMERSLALLDTNSYWGWFTW